MSHGNGKSVLVSITCVKCKEDYTGNVRVNFVDSVSEKSTCPGCGGTQWKIKKHNEKGKKEKKADKKKKSADKNKKDV